MKRWLARAVGAPGSTSLRRFRRVVSRARERQEWADHLADDALVDAARSSFAAADPGSSVEPSPELLAILRAAAQRTLAQTPFDEQLLACCALLTGHAVEMDTGEGKTLVGALAAVGFAIAGRRVHVLSVNDYLAERDADWMRPLFDALGVSVGWIGQHTDSSTRREVYRNDVVYAPTAR